MNWNSTEGRLLKLAYDQYIKTGIPYFLFAEWLSKLKEITSDVQTLQEALRRLGALNYVKLDIAVTQVDAQGFLITDNGLNYAASYEDVLTSPGTKLDEERLIVFLCHASEDKDVVRKLYLKLINDGRIKPWLDEENLIPGQDWTLEIPKAVKAADAVVVCLSKKFKDKRGYVQKEIKFALDAADEVPEGNIFIIPLKLEECEIPEQLVKWQAINFSEDEDRSYQRLLQALELRANQINKPFRRIPKIVEKLETTSDIDYFPGLEDLDKLVFQAACKRAIEQGHNRISSHELWNNSLVQSITKQDFKEILEVLERLSWIVKVSKVMDEEMPVSGFEINLNAFEAYAKAFIPKYLSIKEAVRQELLDSQHRMDREISTALGQPLMVIKHILLLFQERSLIETRRYSGDTLRVNQITPLLKRGLKEPAKNAAVYG